MTRRWTYIPNYFDMKQLGEVTISRKPTETAWSRLPFMRSNGMLTYVFVVEGGDDATFISDIVLSSTVINPASIDVTR